MFHPTRDKNALLEAYHRQLGGLLVRGFYCPGSRRAVTGIIVHGDECGERDSYFDFNDRHIVIVETSRAASCELFGRALWVREEFLAHYAPRTCACVCVVERFSPEQVPMFRKHGMSVVTTYEEAPRYSRPRWWAAGKRTRLVA
jgi:hypothetical protein